MTLEEMQTVWSEMTQKIEKQERLTDTLIMEMTQQKINTKIGSINRYESGGAIICYIAAFILVLHLGKLDTWYLQVSGIIVLAYLLVIPTMVLWSVKQMKLIDLAKNSLKQSFVDFSKRRNNFLLLQRIGIGMNFVLMVLILPVFGKIVNDKDLFIDDSNRWFWYILIMVLFLVPFSIWGYRSYKRMTLSVETLLKDLEQND